jgi:hypothetical protein
LKTVTLKISDDYFNTVVEFLNILPKKSVRIDACGDDDNIANLKSDISKSFKEIKKGKTRAVKVID